MLEKVYENPVRLFTRSNIEAILVDDCFVCCSIQGYFKATSRSWEISVIKTLDIDD